MDDEYRHMKCCKCHMWYDEPRLLPDGHTLCTRCIRQLSQHDGSIKCPNCDKVQTLPDNGVEGLNIDEFMLEILKSIQCEDCWKYDPEIPQCDVCKVNVCGMCSTLHRRKDICNVLTAIRQVELNAPDDEQTAEIEVKCERWRDALNQINKSKASLSHAANQFNDKLERIVIQQQDRLTKAQLTAEKRVEEMTNVIHSRSMAQAFRNRLNDRDDAEYITKIQDVIEGIQRTQASITVHLNEVIQPPVAKSETLSNGIVKLTGLLEAEYGTTGKQTVLESSDSHTQVEVDSSDTAIQTTQIQTTNVTTQKPVDYSGYTVTRRIIVTDDYPQCDGVYDVTSSSRTGNLYVAATQIHFLTAVILVYDKHLNYLRNIQAEIADTGRVKIHVNMDEELMVVRPQTTSVLVMDQYGQHTVHVNIETGNYIDGIVSDTHHRIYVSSYQEGHVAKFNRNGKLLLRIGTGRLTVPEDLAIRDDKIYVSHDYNRSIVVFTVDGELLSEFNVTHNSRPQHFCLDHDGHVLSMELDRGRVHVYNSSTGEYQTSVSAHRSGTDDRVRYGDVMRWQTAITVLPSSDKLVMASITGELTVFS